MYSSDIESDIKSHALTIADGKIANPVFILVLIWYACANVSVITSKIILQQYPYPFLLCCVQFYIAFLVLGFANNRIGGAGAKSSLWSQLPAPNKQLIIFTSIAYTLGFIFTNIAFSISKTSFVETIKSAEPFSSVFLGYIYFHDELSVSTFTAVCIICFGVGMACFGERNFDTFGFMFAVLSNFGFSARATFAKLYFKSFPNSLDEVKLFYFISAIGTVILVPLTIVFDGANIWIRVTNLEKLSLSSDVLLYLLNGLAYSTYNLMSYLVLTRVVLVNHAVLNVFRRVVIIVVSTFYFNISLNALNILGCVIATTGVVIYSRTR